MYVYGGSQLPEYGLTSCDEFTIRRVKFDKERPL